MKEFDFKIGKKVRNGIAAASLVAFSAACGSGDNSGENVVQTNFTPKTSNTVLEAEDFKIEKIGKNVFKIWGSNQENAVSYISDKCEIESVGVWELGGVHGDYVRDRVVTVQDGECLGVLR